MKTQTLLLVYIHLRRTPWRRSDQAPSTLPLKHLNQKKRSTSRARAASDRQPSHLQSNVSDLHNEPCVEIRFSNIPRSRHGIIFGRDPECDVVIPFACNSASNHHFGLNFDEKRRLIVKDWGSLLGTEVAYDGKGTGKRRGFSWIVGGEPILLGVTEITITIDVALKFRLVAVHHDITSEAYIENVDRFHQGKATTEDLFKDLDLPQRPETKLPSGFRTPGKGEIHLSKELGRGSFGVVRYFWNVSNGNEYAVKEPTVRAMRRGMINANAWEKEARIMASLSHPHIVQFLSAEFDPRPQLRLEYVPEGALEEHENISRIECVSILRQCLSALEYLHGRDPPVVHRDIKPAKILVQRRSSDDIFVKFGDFGLSRDSADLSTLCGTQKYLAPEIYQNQEYINSGGEERRNYSPAVDVWSLGVVVYELVCNLPPYQARYRWGGIAWCKEIAAKLEMDLQMRPDQLKQCLSDTMVVLSPNSRGSAKDCHSRALLLPSAVDDGCERSNPTSQQALSFQGAGDTEKATGDYCVNAKADALRKPGAVDHVADDRGREAAPSGEYLACFADDTLIDPSRWTARPKTSLPPRPAPKPRIGKKRPRTESRSSSLGRRRSKRIDRHGWRSFSRSQLRGDALAQALRKKEPLQDCSTDRQAGYKCSAKEAIQAAAIAQALPHDPRGTKDRQGQLESSIQ